jgi:uncharacterized membrane protein
MPDIASLHPIIVHFVVALGLVGVLLRLVSLTGKLAWTGPAAALLLVGAATASVLAAQSGTQAHGVAERIPGAREAVQEHEEAGETTRNLFLVVGALELAALALRSRSGLAKGLLVASGLVGIGAAVELYEAGEHGGELVYGYAGGVGTRLGDTTDVRRLLIAGLYHQARTAREAGRLEESARLIDELGKQAPDDPSVKLLGAESLLKDRNDPPGALAALAAIQADSNDRFVTVRKGLLASEAWVAAGQKDSAKVILSDLRQRFPQARAVAEALKKLDSTGN